jgi:hypothetical protein
VKGLPEKADRPDVLFGISAADRASPRKRQEAKVLAGADGTDHHWVPAGLPMRQVLPSGDTPQPHFQAW